MPVKTRRIIACVAFAFLLLSQQLGITHAISHISSGSTPASSQKKQLLGEMQCAQCLAFAALGSGLNGQPPSVMPVPELSDAAAAPLLFKPLPATLRAFDSRAPPLLV